MSYIRQLKYFAKLKKHQWLKEKDIGKIQEKKLVALLSHAYENVPFYQDLFESHGIEPKDIKTVNDLKNFPFLTKEDIRKNFPDKIVAREADISQCLIRSTTGSTGMPLKVAFSPEMLKYQESVSFFAFFECGLRLTDNLAKISHESYENNLFPSLAQRFGILQWKSISIFSPVESIIKSLKKLKVDVIRTYPSMLLLIANQIEAHNISGVTPRLILSGGETLTDINRAKICKIFNSDIHGVYGAEEFGHMAFECEKHAGYHIVSDAFIIEAVKDDRVVAEGEEGEIVVTNLYNNVMPLIRYKLGDIVTISNEKCACGRELPLIKSIEGRTDDFLILPSGKKISPRMINVIEEISGVSRYKTIQENKNRIVVNLVQGNGFSEETINEIKKHIRAGCLGEDVEVDVKLVEELPLEKRGKLRAVASNVKE